jgi:hypothetical protein
MNTHCVRNLAAAVEQPTVSPLLLRACEPGQDGPTGFAARRDGVKFSRFQSGFACLGQECRNGALVSHGADAIHSLDEATWGVALTSWRNPCVQIDSPHGWRCHGYAACG